MTHLVRRSAAFLALLLLLPGCSPEKTDSLTIFAAASLQDVAQDLADAFTETQSIAVVFNFAGSNTLAEQIKAAPGADLFLSADPRLIDDLEGAGRVADSGRRQIFSNRLVLIARTDSPHVDIRGAADLVDVDRLALARPEAVPAGRYARDILQKLDLWDALEEQVVPTLDVRANLALVESDPAIVGAVYRTDALTSQKVRILAELTFPGVDVAYAAAVIAGSSQEAAARRFLDFLASDAGREIVVRHGFGELRANEG